jgi:hypothetical protein
VISSEIPFCSLSLRTYTSFLLMLIRLITCLIVSVQGVKKPATKSSLFQAYSMSPYSYPPYYMPYPMAFYPMQSPQAGPGPNYYVQPEIPGYPMPPYGYQPIAAPQAAPAPSKEYYYPTYPNPPPMMNPAVNMATMVTHSPPIAPAIPENRLEPPVSDPQTQANAQDPTQSTGGPIKAALSAALEEASKEIDQVNKHTAELTSLDKLSTQSSFKLPKISLSEESVPIDDHILNWKELIGVPDKNPLIENREPVNAVSMPLLSGKWN